MARTDDLYEYLNGFIEVAMTVFGLMVVLTPLALWVAWNETVYYGTLATAGIGAGVFVLFAKLLQRLHRDRPEVFDPEARRLGETYATAMRTGRLTDWEGLQEDDPEVRRQRMTLRDDVMRDLKLTFLTAAGLLLAGGGMLIAAWTYAVMRYGGGD